MVHMFWPLPEKLYLELNNLAKNNKNQNIMAFLSMLIAHKVFQETQVEFYLSEDIDGYFSY